MGALFVVEVETEAAFEGVMAWVVGVGCMALSMNAETVLSDLSAIES